MMTNSKIRELENRLDRVEHMIQKLEITYESTRDKQEHLMKRIEEMNATLNRFHDILLSEHVNK